MTKPWKWMTAFVSLLAASAWGGPAPDDILKSSLTLLRGASRVSVNATVMNDEVVATGQKLQRTSEGTLRIRRPNGLRMDVTADRYRRSIRYDGKTLTVFDPDQKYYATFPAPATIDATVAAVREKIGLDIPLGQLFADDPFAALQARTRVGTYVGLHRVDGVPCHHLAYSQENLDWQIWIAAEGPALPKKIVIDYKTRPGRPQYIALLSNWNLNAALADGEFVFSPPAGAQKIEFIQAEGSTHVQP